MIDKSYLIQIPPFRDSHIHFVIDGKAIGEEEILNLAKILVKHGIFEVKEMGYKKGLGLKAKKILANSYPLIPLKVKASGYAIYKRGTYGVFLGLGVSERQEIKKVINELAQAGIDFLKVVNSGVVSSRIDKGVTPGGFTLEELKVICAEAQERNLKIACHANGDQAVREAVIAGVSSIEHGFFVSDETIYLMAERKVLWTPTIYALQSIKNFITTFEGTYIDKVIEGHLRSIKLADSLGVQLAVGTDSGSKGVVHGNSFLSELALFKKAGLSFEEILKAACQDQEEIKKGNYIVVPRDFIETKKIEGVYYNFKKIF
ncbi:MAG: amidohydrolase family protein [Thermodesulfovibrionales bacterium]|nr:amidohydrolase family protein [Thermodesulfovibrionales bacterium]